jgi:hypothetical protein
MKLLVLLWRDPTGSLQEERFDMEKVKVRTEPGWLKLTNDTGPLRLIPSDKVCLVQFVEPEEKSRIVSPHLTAVAPPS